MSEPVDLRAVAALTKALVRTGMYVDAGIDGVVGLDKPQVYAAAILNDPDLAADGLHFVMRDYALASKEADR